MTEISWLRLDLILDFGMSFFFLWEPISHLFFSPICIIDFGIHISFFGSLIYTIFMIL